jgi:hypothetical protein
MSNPPAVSSIAEWLHAGYPDGIPDDDYAALLALLAPRHLSDDEVTDIAGQLKRSSQHPVPSNM